MYSRRKPFPRSFYKIIIFSGTMIFNRAKVSRIQKKSTMGKVNVLENILLASSRTVSCHFKKLNQNAGYRFPFHVKRLLFHFHLKCQLKCHLVTVLLRREGKKTTKALHGALQFTFLHAHQEMKPLTQIKQPSSMGFQQISRLPIH